MNSENYGEIGYGQNLDMLRSSCTMGKFAWGPKSQVPLMSANPNMETKFQLLRLKKP